MQLEFAFHKPSAKEQVMIALMRGTRVWGQNFKASFMLSWTPWGNLEYILLVRSMLVWVCFLCSVGLVSWSVLTWICLKTGQTGFTKLCFFGTRSRKYHKSRVELFGWPIQIAWLKKWSILVCNKKEPRPFCTRCLALLLLLGGVENSAINAGPAEC